MMQLVSSALAMGAIMIQKLRQLILGCAIILATTAGSANSAVTFTTFAGTVNSAFDYTGVFGLANTSLDGAAYRLTYVIDDATPGAILYSNGNTETSIQGQVFANPIMATLEINNRSFYFGRGNPIDSTIYQGGSARNISRVDYSFVGYGTSSSFQAQDGSRYFTTSIGSSVQNDIIPFSVPFDYHTPWSYNLTPQDMQQSNFSIFQEISGSIVDRAQGSLSINSIVVSSTAPPVNSLAPTDIELAKLSEAIYTNGPQDLSGFAYIQSDPNGLGFGAAAFKRGNEIVVVFRGTDLGSGSGSGLLGKIPAADIFKDFLADGSFVTGVPTSALKNYTTQAAQFLASVAAANPGAQITITGHSLGGALAQLTGNVSGFRVVAFDAPGPQSLAASLAAELSAAQGLSGGQHGAISTFRLFGDPISAVGQQIGSLTTVGSQASQGGLSLTFTAGLKSHVLSNLVSALSNTNEVRAAGLVGPVVNLLNYVTPVGQQIINGLPAYRLSNNILPAIDFGIDPVGGGGYTFLADPGSPSLQSIVLPEMNGIANFSLSAFSGSWGSQIFVNPLARYDFGTGVSGFTLLGYDANGSRMDFAGSLLFDLSFREAGTLNASLIVLPPSSSVPEPMTWVFMIFGFGLVGLVMRLRPPVPHPKGN